MKNQTLLCFDFGEKRIGTAIGQTVTATATALSTIKTINNKPDWNEIKNLIDEWQPDQLIVGQPYMLDGSRQNMTDAAERFSRQLAGRFKIPVDMIDEQLSSFEARRKLKSTRNLDPVAAKLILETWLNKNNKLNNRQDKHHQEN